MVIFHILPTTDRAMGGIAPLSSLGKVRCVNLDIVQWTEEWFNDLSRREVKAAAEPKLETTTGLLVLCVCGVGEAL